MTVPASPGTEAPDASQATDPTAHRPWWAIVVSAVVSIVFVIRGVGRTPDGGFLFTLFDDATISMVYARNLVEGNGLVWSPGREAVEGYSNLGWTLVMAGTHLIPFPDRFAALPMVVIGVAIVAATIWLTWKLVRALAPEDPRSATIAAWFVAACYPIYYWSLRGTEVGIAGVLLLGACTLALRLDTEWTRRCALQLGLVFAVASLVRDDLLVPCGVVGLFLLWQFRSDQPVRRLWPVVVPVVVAVVAHEIFRLAVYGELLPNTYHLKLAGIPISTRLEHGFSALFRDGMYGILLLAIIALAALVRARGLRLWLPLAVFGSTMAYSVWVGGDAWEWMLIPNRYVSATLPLLIAAAVLGITRLSGRFGISPVTPAVVVAVLAFALPWGYIVSDNGGPRVVTANEWANQGILIEANTPEDITIAVIPAGNVPYFARRDALDLLGKNDHRVARVEPQSWYGPGHNRFDLDYTLGELQPELVVQIWELPAHLQNRMEQWGYVPIGNAWYLPGTFDPAFLEDGFPTDFRHGRLPDDTP